MNKHSLRTAFLAVLLSFVALASEAQYPRRTELPTVYVDTYGKSPITSKTEYVNSTLRWVDEQAR